MRSTRSLFRRRSQAAVAATAAVATACSLLLSPVASANPFGSLGEVLGDGELTGLSAPEEPAEVTPLEPAGDGSPQATSAYWTPERMRNAEPKDVVKPPSNDESTPDSDESTPDSDGSSPDSDGSSPDSDGSSPDSDAPESSPEGDSESPRRPVNAEPYIKPGQPLITANSASPMPTVGKVFFTRGNSDYVCSASSVAAENRGTVATAGHCVYADGQWVSQFIFVPAYENGNAPYGQFVGVGGIAPNEWLYNENLAYDTAFVRVRPADGKDLTDAVGSFGVGFNVSPDIGHRAYGYPAQQPFNGERLYSCQGRNSPDGPNLGIASCDMNGGASGGPWIGQGVQTSVNSYIHPGRLGMYGPYWGPEIKDAYEAAQRAA